MATKWIWLSLVLVGFALPAAYRQAEELWQHAQWVTKMQHLYPAKVILFSDEACGFCQKTRVLLQSKQIAFTEVNVGRFGAEQDKQAFALLHHRQVPVLLVGSALIKGYQPAEIEAALADLPQP